MISTDRTVGAAYEGPVGDGNLELMPKATEFRLVELFFSQVTTSGVKLQLGVVEDANPTIFQFQVGCSIKRLIYVQYTFHHQHATEWAKKSFLTTSCMGNT